MSRTVDELLAEALVHFDAATEYAQVTDRDPRMILDAMSMRLFAGLETLTRVRGTVTGDLPGAIATIRLELEQSAHSPQEIEEQP